MCGSARSPHQTYIRWTAPNRALRPSISAQPNATLYFYPPNTIFNDTFLVFLPTKLGLWLCIYAEMTPSISHPPSGILYFYPALSMGCHNTNPPCIFTNQMGTSNPVTLLTKCHLVFFSGKCDSVFLSNGIITRNSSGSVTAQT